MESHIGTFRTEEIARKWLTLAMRRRDHLEELHSSGRWRKYYSEEKLFALKRATERTMQDWQALAGRMSDVTAGIAEAPDAPSIRTPDDALSDHHESDRAGSGRTASEPALDHADA